MFKLTKLFLALSLLILLNSCGKDDDSPDVDSLVGEWTAIAFTASIESTINASGTETTIATSAVGSNLSYDLTFTDDAFTTSGGYDVTNNTTVDGNVFPASMSTYSNVSGSGNYSTSGNTITLDGSFFTFDVNGMDLSALNQEQSANYEINSNGELIFTQNETITDNSTPTVTSTTKLVSSSTWVRK